MKGIILVYLLSTFCWAPTEKNDPYTVFLKYVWHNSRYWHPTISSEDVSNFTWSTWEGVEENQDAAKQYFHVCVNESGMCCLDNEAGFGYSGARWSVIWKVTKHGKWYSRKHPWVINNLMAHYFYTEFYKKPVCRWHNSHSKKFDSEYTKAVTWISNKCELMYPVFTGGKDVLVGTAVR